MILCEKFGGPELDPRLTWHCQPARWVIRESQLVIEPEGSTDFWQRTHYGFSADNGHLLHATPRGDFAMTTRVEIAPAHQYDQAGLMVRCSPDCWLKASVEFEPGGPNQLGAVLTREGYSDWSTQDFDVDRKTIELRLTLRGQDVKVEYRDGPRWIQLRLGHLPLPRDQRVQAGLYACSPKAAGFVARFDYLSIEEL